MLLEGAGGSTKYLALQTQVTTAKSCHAFFIWLLLYLLAEVHMMFRVKVSPRQVGTAKTRIFAGTLL